MTTQEMNVALALKVMGWPLLGPFDPLRLAKSKGGYVNGDICTKFPAGDGIIGTQWWPTQNIADAWDVHRTMCGMPFSKRQRYLASLQEQASEVVNVTRRAAMREYTPLVVAWPDVLVVLHERMPEAICKAALAAVEEKTDGR